jgi:hypothetical protein
VFGECHTAVPSLLLAQARQSQPDQHLYYEKTRAILCREGHYGLRCRPGVDTGLKEVIGDDSGRIVVASGLLRYTRGEVVFESFLSQDSDEEWRVYGFRLRADLDPAPYRACQ